jgi:glycosyltransferase involved in cell wall biosynthesis
MSKNLFERDAHPGRPKILFVGLPESSHTHSWIDLLEGAEFNVRLFALPTGLPPDDWKVRTYVTDYTDARLDPATRASLFPRSRVGRVARRGVARALGRWDVEGLRLKWLSEVVRGWRPDVIHTLGLTPASYFYAEARERFGLQGVGKWVAQARGGPDLALHRLLPEHVTKIRAVLAGCDEFIADNRQNYEYGVELGLDEGRASALGVVPGTGGIDVEAIAAGWASSPPSGRKLILWPKAYECPQSKSLPVLEALRLAWARMPPCEIHMLVTIPETRMWLATLPEEIRRSCRVHDRVPREEVLELMTRARVMLAPSLSDGVPNSMYEAMAAGAFPVVSPLDTIRPVVEGGRNVLFARNLYPEEIAEALLRAMTDDQLVDGAAPLNLELVRRLAGRAEIRRRVVEYYGRLAADAVKQKPA